MWFDSQFSSVIFAKSETFQRLNEFKMLLRKQLEALELTYPDAVSDSETGSVPSVTKVFHFEDFLFNFRAFKYGFLNV